MKENQCQSCGATLPGHALAGRCPRCLLLEGLDSDSRFADGGSVGLTTEAGPVLETISATIGRVPRVLLRDTAIGEEPGPIVRPPGALAEDRSTRYRIDGEIARGGMGAVLKGRDADLGRDVAIKVLRDDLRDKGDLVRRFVEEAQIGGQLQHPGIVPIYELGTFADRRPYFSMKLVKGETLADMLASRSGPADDLPRFLSIFAAVTQTMAYSHTRGVIHRDLKPSNVMVGSFGEVQVMDWGLAKVLPRGGAVADAKAGVQPSAETLIATARSGSNEDLSQAGSVLGTPSYMAPEQARGENELINERVDVFALGSILGEILTGSPAFTGRSSGEILRKAARGDTALALSRLDDCGAEGELIALAKHCLAVEREDRPRDANVVSERITSYLAGVQERVQAAERERAVAVARAIEERRRRKVQLALAASVLAFTMLGGLSAAYYLQQRAEQSAAVDRVVGQAETLRDQAKANPEDLSRWRVALVAVEQAEAGRVEGARSRLLALHDELQAGLAAQERDRALLDRLIDIRSASAEDETGSATDAAYAEAFRDAGIDLASLATAEAGARVKANSPAVVLGLTEALDDWSAIRRGKLGNAANAAKLSEVARIADPNTWRDELRTALGQADKAARLKVLQELAKTAKFDELGPISLKLLGTGLNADGDSALAESVLRSAQQRHPRDLWLNYELGHVLERLSRRDDAIRFYTAARMIRPETAHDLGHALELRGDFREAITVFSDLVALRPKFHRHLLCLAGATRSHGMSGEVAAIFERGVAAHREAARLKPDSAEAHAELAVALGIQGKLDEAVVELRTVERLDPYHGVSWEPTGPAIFNGMLTTHAFRSGRVDAAIAELSNRLGDSLKNQGKIDDAIVAYREAARHRPEDRFFSALVLALKERGKLDEAVAFCREKIRKEPNDAATYFELGGMLRAQGDIAGARSLYRTGHELGSKQPGWRYASAHLVADLCKQQGDVLLNQGKLDDAIVALDESIDVNDMHDPGAYSALIRALKMQGKLDARVAAYREAMRKEPDNARVYFHLGGLLEAQGDTAGAIALYRKGHELESKRPGSRHRTEYWIERAEQAAARDERFRAVVSGEAPANNNDERLALAHTCGQMKRYAAAARLTAEALEKDAKLGDDFRSRVRHQAVARAVLAGVGRGEDDPRPDEAARNRLRAQARGWLRADLELYSNTLKTVSPADRKVIVNQLQHWKACGELALVHDQGGLAKLSDAEQKDWQAIWRDVDRLLERAILNGKDKPGSPEEALALAKLCYDTKRYAAGTRFWAEAFAADPKLGDDQREWSRYNAACAAVLAAAGQGEDAATLDGAERARLRRQALDWLRADLSLHAKHQESGPAAARAAVGQMMKHWQQDSDLVSVRDRAAMAKLNEAEGTEWAALWKDVDGLLAKVARP